MRVDRASARRVVRVVFLVVNKRLFMSSLVTFVVEEAAAEGKQDYEEICEESTIAVPGVAFILG